MARSPSTYLQRCLAAALLPLSLAACGEKSEVPTLPRGDEILPDSAEAVGLSHCDDARLELAAIVLNGPPKGSSLDDVHDASAPGCTWISAYGDSRVRLNVYDETVFPALQIEGPTPQYEALVDTFATGGQGVTLEGLGIRAARFGFLPANPQHGVIIVETPSRVLEFVGHGVAPAKLEIFARGVTETIEKTPRT
jgi:hypothetical protein